MRHAQVVAASFAAVFLFAFPALSDSIESAVAGYSDNDRINTILSASTALSSAKISGSEDLKTNFSLGYTHRTIKFKDTLNNAYLTGTQLNGKNTMEQYTLNVGVDQQISTTLSAGVLTGITESPLGVTKWNGARIGQWWRHETLQTTFEARHTKTEQIPGVVYDDDRRQLRLPEELGGNNYNLGFMHFTTPELIWRGTYSRTLRSDRPPADGITSELRYFVTPLQAAIHGAVGHFENVGEVGNNTSYGGIVGNSVSGEWHQRLFDRYIVMGGYRWYKEDENARTESNPRKSLGSDWIHGSIRWRFGDGAWLSDSSEWSIFGGQYKNNEPRKCSLIGSGLKISL